MTDRGHGGPRQPANPAAVSGPGALSRRTDGGAGSKTQPVRVPSGGKYGERKAAEEQQAAAPMAAGGPPAPGGGAVTGAPPSPGGAFGPTQRPNEANDMMPPQGVDPTQSPDAVLRAMYRKFPSQHLSRLIGTMPSNIPEAPPREVAGG